MAAVISAVSVSGARSASFAVSCLAGEAFTFADLAAAILDPAKGGAAGNAQSNALYAFLLANVASDLTATQLAWRSNGVSIAVVNDVAATLDVRAASIGSVGVLTATKAQIRISLASSISA